MYCRQVYDYESGIQAQLLMGLEKPLLLRSINTRWGKKREDVTVETALPVFRRLFHKMGKVFRVETEDEITKDHLLNTDEFRTEFMKGYPCSMLFGTKAGYFIFCYRTWRMKKQKTV